MAVSIVALALVTISSAASMRFEAVVDWVLAAREAVFGGLDDFFMVVVAVVGCHSYCYSVFCH